MRIKAFTVLFVFLSVAAFASIAAAQNAAPGVEGTVWVGPDADDTDITTLYFEKGGVLSYEYGGNSYRNGTWWQDGETVNFQMNDGYRVFTGTINGRRLAGESKNVLGKQWTSTFYLPHQPNCDAKSFVLSKPCEAPQPETAAKGARRPIDLASASFKTRSPNPKQ